VVYGIQHQAALPDDELLHFCVIHVNVQIDEGLVVRKKLIVALWFHVTEIGFDTVNNVTLSFLATCGHQCFVIGQSLSQGDDEKEDTQPAIRGLDWRRNWQKRPP
jgi:hypothetical protein